MIKDKFYKKLSNSERFYQVCENLAPPFSLQMIVEGNGELSVKSLENAVRLASEANRGTRLILKNSGLKKYWIDSEIPPPIKEIHDKSFHEFDEQKIIIQSSKNPHLYNRLDIEKGPTCEIIIIRGQKTKILFRALHSVMDARGLLFWSEEVFRALRGDELLGTNTTISDIDYYKSFNKKSNINKVPLKSRNPSPLGKKLNNDWSPVWARKQINGKFSSLVSQLAYLLAQESYSHQDKNVEIMISSDLRNKENNFRTTGNLSSPIYINIDKKDSWIDIYSQIISKFNNNDDKQVDKSEVMVHIIPIKLMTLFLKKHLKKIYSEDSFIFSVAIANIGKLNPKSFDCNSFQCSNIMFLPVDIPGYSISLMCTELPDHTELFLSAPAFLTSNERFKNLINNLENGLKKLNNLGESGESKILDNNFLQSIKKFNNTETNYSKDKTVIDLFKEQVNLFPNNIAVSLDCENITFKELDERSDLLAKYIKDLESEKNPLNKLVDNNIDKIIGLLTTHSTETIISILSILKAGYAYLPIDPDQPKERIKFMFNDANVSFVITNIKNMDNLTDKKIIFLDNNFFNNNKSQNLNFTPINNDLAYIMYTSGSTVQPKGVRVSNLNLINYILWVKKYGLIENEKTIYPFYTSLSFDLTLTSIFLPLVTGNQIEVYKNEYHKFAVKKIVDDRKANIIKLTPTHLKLMNELNTSFDNIKKIITLGENLSTDLAYEVYKKSGNNIQIINQYGPTEATIGCMSHIFDPEKDNKLSIPIGTPGDNTYIYLLNENKKEVETGQEGEIYISGDCVTKGYLNRESLTNQCFIDDPFRQGYKMYKTGDLGLRLPNFEIEYIQRIDDQVKLNGYRIELGEIQSLLCKHQLIKDSVVMINTQNDNINDHKYLVAFYKSENEIDQNELKNFLSDKLPNYMIPLKYIHVKDIPLTVNGKTDKKYLLSIINKEVVDIKNENNKNINAIVINAISKITLIPENKILLEHNIFDLGLDSLGVSHLFSILTKELLAENSNYLIKNLEGLLINPTIKNLINIIEKV